MWGSRVSHHHLRRLVARTFELLRQPEIADDDGAISSDQKVVQLEVSMQHATFLEPGITLM
jgi:hypothetical protein